MDNCQHCIFRGNIKECKSTLCFHHESWFAQEQHRQIQEMKEHLIYIRSIVVEGALADGFDPLKGEWAEKLFMSNSKTSELIKRG